MAVGLLHIAKKEKEDGNYDIVTWRLASSRR